MEWKRIFNELNQFRIENHMRMIDKNFIIDVTIFTENH